MHQAKEGSFHTSVQPLKHFLLVSESIDSYSKASMADPLKSPPLTRDSVVAAHALVKEYIHYTPVLTNTTLTQLASTPQSPSVLEGTPWEGQTPANPKIKLWFKCENLQKVGAFKVRGAFHALKRLMAEEGWEASGGRERGVTTHSSGIPLSA